MKRLLAVCLTFSFTAATSPVFAQDATIPRLVVTPTALRQADITREIAKPTERGASTPASSSHMSKSRRVLTVIALGIGGFFAGAALGAQLEPNCRCDDPGLKGMVIGAPLGAMLGVIIGGRLN